METLQDFDHLKLYSLQVDEMAGLDPAALAMLRHRLHALFVPDDVPPALDAALCEASRRLEDQRS